jgi:hypothetical protein
MHRSRGTGLTVNPFIHPLPPPLQPFYFFFASLLGLACCTASVASLVTIVTPRKSHVTAFVAVTMLLWCCSGVVLPPDTLRKNLGVRAGLLLSTLHDRTTEVFGHSHSWGTAACRGCGRRVVHTSASSIDAHQGSS